MPSTRRCGARGRRCRCACRHRRKLCITSCSAARRQLARRRQCDARGAGVGVAGAVWRLVRPVWRRQVARHRVGVFRAASRRSSAGDPHARRWARAAIAASAVRTSSMIDSVDDAGSGAPSSAGRRLMRALASLASTSLWTAMCASDTAGRRRCAHPRRTLVDPIVDLLAANRGAVAPELEKERDARVAGALHTLTLLAGMPDIMLPTQRLQLLTMVCTHGAKFDRLQDRRRVSARSFRRSRHFTTRTRTRASATPISARRSTSVWPWRRRPTRTGATACWRRSC
jgi:hypothetical protein